MERLSKRNGQSQTISAIDDEILLNDSPSRGTSNSLRSMSPQPTNLGFRNCQQQLLQNIPHASESSSINGLPLEVNTADYTLPLDEQQWTELVEPGNADHLFSSFNWLWSLDEWNDQTVG